MDFNFKVIPQHKSTFWRSNTRCSLKDGCEMFGDSSLTPHLCSSDSVRCASFQRWKNIRKCFTQPLHYSTNTDFSHSSHWSCADGRRFSIFIFIYSPRWQSVRLCDVGENWFIVLAVVQSNWNHNKLNFFKVELEHPENVIESWITAACILLSRTRTGLSNDR